MRRLIAALAASLLLAAAPAQPFAVVAPGATLAFPADHGAHPAFRTEWWYVTGWLKDANGKDIGFQVTFFRSATGMGADNPSAFAPKQILFAHAALSDPTRGKLLADSRAGRAALGLADAAMGDAKIVLDDWSLTRAADGKFHAVVTAKDFAFDLTFAPTQPPLLEGDKGYSQKGPLPSEASYYYSVPHLSVTGRATRGGTAQAVTGEAWLDREWSSTLLDPKAVGWDWTGINLDDGGALMAFRMRDAAGNPLWAGGTLRAADGTLTKFQPGDVTFTPKRRWRSAATGGDYPVETTLSVRLAGGTRNWTLTPLFDDQELDSRGLVGPVYWEGAVTTQGGRGYLELTGYAGALKF